MLAPWTLLPGVPLIALSNMRVLECVCGRLDTLWIKQCVTVLIYDLTLNVLVSFWDPKIIADADCKFNGVGPLAGKVLAVKLKYNVLEVSQSFTSFDWNFAVIVTTWKSAFKMSRNFVAPLSSTSGSIECHKNMIEIYVINKCHMCMKYMMRH